MNDHRARFSLFALLALLALPVLIFADASPPTLLILPFENATGQVDKNAVSKGFPDLVSAFLAPESEHVRLVDRDRLDQLMAEEGLKRENLTSETAIGQIGHLAQAQYILRGSVTGADKNLEVRAFLYETESLRLVKSFESRKDVNLNGHAESIAHAVAQFFAADLKPLPLLPVDPEPDMNLHKIQGLGYYYEGQYTKAIPEFMKVLAKQPRDADAKYWLGKSFYAAGLKDHAAIEFRQFLDWFAKDSRASDVKSLLDGKP